MSDAIESLEFQVMWDRAGHLTDLDVEVDVLACGTPQTRDMPSEGPTVRVTKVVETLVTVDDEEVKHTWDLTNLPPGFLALVEDLVVAMLGDRDPEEVRDYGYAFSRENGHRDSDYWA